MKVQMWGYFYRDRDNNLMWKNVIGGYKRVPGQNNWLKPLKRNVYMWFVENITVKCISSRMDSTVLVTWSRRLSHVTNALQSKQPNSHFSEQGKCHHHGWWGDLVLFSLKIFNTSRSFNSLLLLHYVPRGGRRRVFLRILPGLTLPLKKLSNMITPGFQIQSERLLVWKLLILKRETCELISNVKFSHLKATETRSGQVRLETAQAESWEAWTVCLVWLWTCQNRSASMWWHLWGELDRKEHNWSHILAES